MQFEVVFLLLFGFCRSAPHEGLPLLNPGGIGGIFKGPDSETIIIGPDGSEITSEEKGGVVVRDDALGSQPIVVAEPAVAVPAPIINEERIAPVSSIIASTGAPILVGAPAISSASSVLASSSAPLLTGEIYDLGGPDYIDAPLGGPVGSLGVSIAPILAPVDPLVTSFASKPVEIVEQDPHIVETEIIEAPDVETEQSSDLEGPSGRIITKGSASVVSGPASTTITEPRKIIVVPPKIAIGTPVIATATIPLTDVPLIAPLPAVPFESGSTVVPSLVGYSTTPAPVNLAYSTTATPLVDVSSTVGFDSGRINLGAGNLREFIPVVEYSSSNGVINGQSLAAATSISSTEVPVLSSSLSTITTDKFAPFVGPAIPSAYLVPPAAPTTLAATAGLGSSTASPNIQKISRIDENIAVDGRVDMGYPLYKKSTTETYQLPQVLGMALTRFYRKTPVKEKDRVVIDDKLGELAQNEIASYDTRSGFLPPPDLSQAKYISPALSRNGIDTTQVNLAPVPLSEVTRLSDGAYQSGYNTGYLNKRNAKNIN